jgi:hypothetical protein
MPFYAGQDVTDVLDDPDFNAPITVLSSTIVVGAGGIASVTARTPGGVMTLAVVVPNTGYVLIQDDAGNNVQGDIDIYTRYPLSTGGKTRDADVIIWNDDTYRLIVAKPFLYGPGFTHAIGKLATVNANDPQDASGSLTPSTPTPGGGFLG